MNQCSWLCAIESAQLGAHSELVQLLVHYWISSPDLVLQDSNIVHEHLQWMQSTLSSIKNAVHFDQRAHPRTGPVIRGSWPENIEIKVVIQDPVRFAMARRKRSTDTQQAQWLSMVSEPN